MKEGKFKIEELYYPSAAADLPQSLAMCYYAKRTQWFPTVSCMS